MKAVGFFSSLPINDTASFVEVACMKPQPSYGELLVKIQAIAVNPVDYKVRQNAAKGIVLPEPKIIGWDATGIVESVGIGVEGFEVGDAVFYAGNIAKQGCYAEYQVVDYRIVAHRPKLLSIEGIAAMPLTSLTAWEMLFDRMKIDKEQDRSKTILIIGGAGGVGSIAIQLAKRVANLQVIATAFRPESATWCRAMGADYIVNTNNLVGDVRNQGFEYVDYIIDLVNTNFYWDAMVDLIRPQGHIASITGSDEPIALNKLKSKSVSFSWEYMYTRPFFQTDDIIQQQKILTEVAVMLDEGVLQSTHQQSLRGLTAANIKAAHQQLESGTTIGKIVIVL